MRLSTRLVILSAFVCLPMSETLAQSAALPTSTPAATSGLSTPAPSTATKVANHTSWVTFDDCPVLLEQRTVVPARESGIVAAVNVELNASVEKDQLLLSLEKEEAESALKSARESHTYAVEVSRDDSELNLRKVELQIAEEELRSNLEIKKSVSASELRRLRLDVARAEVAVTIAQRALKRTIIQADLSGTAVQTAAVKLANREVRAPSAGKVSELLVHPGEWVDIGKPVMVIQDLSQLQVDCLIPIEQADLTNLVGLEVRVESTKRSASGQPIQLNGKVTSYDSKLSAHGEVRVHCRIENIRQGGEWLLLPDMNVRLEMAAGATKVAQRQ